MSLISGAAVRGLLLFVAVTLASAHAVVAAHAGQPPVWRGSRDATPSAYAWLNEYTPGDTYDITILRGVTKRQVLNRLGGVRRELGKRTYQQADTFVLNHLDRWYSGPTVMQVSRLGHAVVVYQPSGFRAGFSAATLSRGGRVADFMTTVELDTYATVARNGKVVRNFDTSFRPPRKGALPEETGLPFGAKRKNTFATSWAYLERLTLTHVPEGWFSMPRKTYVMHGRD